MGSASRPLADVEAPRVTWLLAVKDGMPYLRETLGSIAAQSYSNAEVFVWDNGSVDGSADELARWIPDRLPGRVVVGRPLPLGTARAKLVAGAGTELCAWIDADDLAAPQRLERQVQFLLEHPEVAAVGCQLLLIDGQGRSLGSAGNLPTSDDDIVRHMLRGPGMAQPAVLFRRSAVLEAGNYRDVGPVNVEDYDLWLRLAARHRLANLPEALLHYRVHDRSTTVRSERRGVLDAAAAARLVDNAPLFGCSGEELGLLVARRHPFALPLLQRVARALERRSGASRWATLRSVEFIYAVRDYIAVRDVITRLVLAALDPTQGAFRREVAAVTRTIVRKFPRLRFVGR